LVRIIPLGGAHEIGASSTIVEIGGLRILVDCGIRPGRPAEQQLPDLARVQDEGGVDAIVLTHAHTDHSGALPVISEAYPDAVIHTTHPTMSLLKVLLYDGLRIMEGRFSAEGEIPLYPEASVDAMLHRVRCAHFMEPVELNERTRLTFNCAGHILGAAMVILEADDGCVLFSGDIHGSTQRTVPGLTMPRARPQVVVCESTYGGRLHADREAEEKRLVQTVADCVKQGGQVLIPAFAVGRAQEVALILRRAMAQRQIPRFPIWMDGMVTAICGVYSKFPDYLHANLSKKIAKGSPVFFDESGIVRRVDAPELRERVLKNGPCCIIASSGMLSGGPSVFYARHLAQSPRNLIAITGYQDEESPGRALTRLAEGKERKIRLNGDEVEVRCRVTRYSLSAHADSGQLVSMVNRLNPQEVMLVHGDAGARNALAKALRRSFDREIHLPRNGDEMVLDLPRNRRSSTQRLVGVGDGRPLDQEALADIWNFLQSIEFPEKTLTVDEILQLWFGYGAVPSDAFEAALPVLNASVHFTRHPRRPFVYQINEKKQVDAALGLIEPVRDSEGRLEQSSLVNLLPKILGDTPDLYRSGFKRDNHTVILYFHFPEVALQRYAEKLAELEKESGWRVVVHPETHQGALNEVVDRLVGDKVIVARAPSIYRDQKMVVLNLEQEPDPEWMAQIKEQFQAETGWQLSHRVIPARACHRRRKRMVGGRMEINQAFALIDRAFSRKRHRPYKKSKKSDGRGEYIELAFITPEVGKRYSELLKTLRKETGWRLQIRREPNSAAINNLAQRLIPEDWGLRGGASLHMNRREVRVRLSNPPENSREFIKVAERFRSATGYRLLKAR